MWLIKQISILALVALPLLWSSIVTAKDASILSSIKPIQLIVNEISQDNSGILVTGSTSVHDYSLRPSDLKKLSQAKVLFWIGPTMESFLAKVIKKFPNLDVVTLIDTQALNLHEGHDHGHSHGSGSADDLTIDMHIWLSPGNALIIAEQIQQKLSAVWPAKKTVYEKNLAAFKQALNQQIALSKQSLLLVKDNGFVSYHNAWEYWVSFFQLKQIDSVVISSEHKPSAKQLYKIRNYFKNKQSNCMLLEPNVNPRQISPLVKGLNVNVTMTDPLAVYSTSYVQWVAQTTERFVNCLSAIEIDEK